MKKLILLSLILSVFVLSCDPESETEIASYVVDFSATLGTNDYRQVSFANTTETLSGSVTGYQWNFGDGNTSAEENPTHSYARPGA
jgi:PKD repeat protein